MIRDEKTLAQPRPLGSPRAFGVTMAVVSCALALLPALSHRAPRWWLVAVASVLLAVSWLRPSILALANHLWLGFAKRLHKVTSLIVLGALFFLVLTPLALALRAFGGDRLRLRRASDSKSYWVDIAPDDRRADFEQPF